MRLVALYALYGLLTAIIVGVELIHLLGTLKAWWHHDPTQMVDEAIYMACWGWYVASRLSHQPKIT